jgi:hypothetical protein
MSSEKPQFQPWNEEEFQADVYVRGMTWLQRLLYRALLQASFFHSTRPYLPNDDEVLWVLAGAENQEMWEQNKAKVLKRWSPCADNPNLLENKRVSKDWFNWKDVRDEAVESGSAGGRKSAEKRRELYGTAQPRPVLTPEGSPKAPFEGPSTDAEGSRRPSEAREVKLREEKLNEDKNTGAEGVSSSAKQPMADWKNIALRHRAVFGKKAGVSFKDKYFEACKTYGEDVVLQCFDDWAAGAKDWVEADSVREPLWAFFKRLPDEAADTVELNAAEKEKRDADKKAHDEKEAKFQTLLAEQIEENQKQWAPKPKTNTVEPEDFFKEE